MTRCGCGTPPPAPVGEPLTGHTDVVYGGGVQPGWHPARLRQLGDEEVRLWGDVWGDVWDVAEACRLAMPYVTATQVETYLPEGRTATVCNLD